MNSRGAWNKTQVITDQLVDSPSVFSVFGHNQRENLTLDLESLGSVTFKLICTWGAALSFRYLLQRQLSWPKAS